MKVRYNNTTASAKSTGSGILSNIGKVSGFVPTLLYLALGVVLIVVGPWIYRYIKGQIQSNEEQDSSIEKTKLYNSNKNPATQQQRADKITKSRELQGVAKQLAIDLGTVYSDTNFEWTSPTSWGILNPFGWTENDKEVRVALVKYRNYYPTLKRLYHDCYSNSRNLSDDVLQKLDKDDMILVKRVLNLT
jgi:hypothetical protein